MVVQCLDELSRRQCGSIAVGESNLWRQPTAPDKVIAMGRLKLRLGWRRYTIKDDVDAAFCHRIDPRIDFPTCKPHRY